MNDLQNFIIKKGLEKASLETIKQAIIQDPYLSNDVKEFWLGVAVSEGVKDEYSEFRVQGAKRYCGRSLKDGELHITVAGVPKSGAKCLNDNIENFQKDFIFSGAITGKKTHKYFFVDDIYTDENGNITGDSIDLSQCDYRLDDIDIFDFEKIFEEEIEVQTYE
jgi:hypothetical protein